MPRVVKDESQTNVFIFEETFEEIERKELREALKELQEQMKKQDKTFTPKKDFTK